MLLLLLISSQSCLTLYNPVDGSLPGSLSLGFSRQEYWSELPFSSLMHKVKSKSEVTQSWLTLCDPMDYSLPGSSVHGILQARILEWVAISFSKHSWTPKNIYDSPSSCKSLIDNRSINT